MILRTPLPTAICTLACVVLSLTSNAWPQCQVNTLTPNVGFNGGRFGLSVDMDGSTAVVGAPGESEGALLSGSVHVFVYVDEERDWGDDVELIPNDPEVRQYFGASVAIEGDIVVVGATSDDEKEADAGAAYVFRKTDDGWEQEAKFLPGDGDNEDAFGISAAIHQGRIVVGESGEEGAAYVYEFDDEEDEWLEVAMLEPSSPQSDELFGETTTVYEDVIAVGAPDLSETEPGGVYLFRLVDDEWEQEQRLSGDAPGDRFGSAVSLGDEILAVGAKWYGDEIYDRAGAVYVFEYDEDEEQWEELALLLVDEQEDDGSYFGSSVRLAESYIFVGAPYATSTNWDRAGLAYVFEQNEFGQWIENSQLFSDDADDDVNLGTSVAYSDGFLIVGAPFYQPGALQSGGVELFAVSGDDCDDDGALDYCEIVDEDEEDCNHNRLIDRCEDSKHDTNENEVPDECEAPLWFTLKTTTAAFVPESGVGSVILDFTIDPNIAANVDDTPLQTDSFEGTIYHDGELLTPDSVAAVGELADINGGDGPDLLIVDMDAGEGDLMTFSVVYSFAGQASIEHSEAASLLEFRYETVADAFRDTEDEVTTDLEFSVPDASPPLQNQAYDQGETHEVLGISLSFVMKPIGTFEFVRGDCNADGGTDLADGIYLLDHLYLDGPSGPCVEACDFNGDGNVNCLDAIGLFNWRYLGAGGPPAPYPDCGLPDKAAACESFAPCQDF